MAEPAGGSSPSHVILLAHGSPDPRHAEGIERLARQVGSQVPGVSVEGAYLQHNRPVLPELLAQLAAAGVGSVLVLPLLLSHGGHLADDVPATVAQARAAVPEVAVELVATLPPERLAAAVLAAVGRASGTAPDALPTAELRIVLVTAGADRKDAMVPFDGLTTALTGAGATVAVANGPRSGLDRALAELAEVDGGAQPPFAVPVMYAQGRLCDVAAERAAELGLVPTDVVGSLAGCAYALAEWIREQGPVSLWRKG